MLQYCKGNILVIQYYVTNNKNSYHRNKNSVFYSKDNIYRNKDSVFSDTMATEPVTA